MFVVVSSVGGKSQSNGAARESNIGAACMCEIWRYATPHDLICRRGLRKHCFTLRQHQYVAQEDLNDGRSMGANVGDRSRNVQNVIRHVLALTSDILSESGSSSPICKIISPHKQACEDMARQSDEAPEMDGCRHCLSCRIESLYVETASPATRIRSPAVHKTTHGFLHTGRPWPR